jgi:hypothetical protein
VRGGERPRLALAEPVASGSVQGANLLASDYQDLPPTSTGHHRTVRLTGADASGQCLLVPGVDGCFR